MFVILYRAKVTWRGRRSSYISLLFQRVIEKTLRPSQYLLPTPSVEWAPLVVWPRVLAKQYRLDLAHTPSGAHVSVKDNIFQVVQVIDNGGPSGRWGGLCGVLGLHNPQGTFKVVEHSDEHYVQYKESEEEKKWGEKIDRKYLRILIRKDPDKFLKEMTPNPKHDGVCVGLNLDHPHHQNLQKEFQKDVRRICKEKGLNDHPALVTDPAVTEKIENANHPRSSQELDDKKVLSEQKKDLQTQNDNLPIKSEEPCFTIH